MNQYGSKIKFVVIIVLIIVMLSSCSGLKRFNGEVVKPVESAPEISLSDQNGQLVQLSNFRNDVVLVFFGFTNCVDECPLTMAHLKQALDLLGEDANKVQVVMITTDPVRDTPMALGNFLGKFNPTFLGLTGTSAELTQVWNEYGVEVLDGGETHSSYTYVVDQKGDLRLHFDPEMTPEDISSDIRVLLAEKSQ